MDEAIESGGPNAEQIAFWNGDAADKWIAHEALLERMLRRLGLRAMARAAPAPGEHALDVGCGCGNTTLELARRVAPSGGVTGIDLSARMLAVARKRVDSAAAPVRVVNADAETHGFPEAAFDVVFSRFGVMFFGRPVDAFANLNGALRPGGRLAFVCWRAAEHNVWVTIPFEAARPHLPEAEPEDPDAPGQFAFARSRRVEGILAEAGFSDIRIEAHDERLRVGRGDLDACVALVLKLGPLSGALREAGESAAPAVAAAVRRAVAPHHTGDALEMDSSTWIVSARRARSSGAVGRPVR